MKFFKRIWDVVKDLSRIMIWVVFIIVIVTVIHFLSIRIDILNKSYDLLLEEKEAFTTLKHNFQEELIDACVTRVKIEAHYVDAELGQALHGTTTKNTP